MNKLNPKLFDHTILKADATKKAVKAVCDEAKENKFASVCVNSYYTEYVAKELKDSGVKVCTVIGFPLGQMSTKAKVAETMIAVSDGAEEIDMVINVGALKDKDYETVLLDIAAVKSACEKKAILKVIIETCLLSDDEKVKACELAKEAGADFVKTSTGFSTGGADASDVKLMRKTVGNKMGVKASGGIRDAKKVYEMVEAGADRLGTSATVAIVKDSINK
ncbi:MAG: deoxyribose-phosphate aldolase [Lachnospiraceae bacterium]|nr:deoxyribose-phosphate aldolase [Lachnospiraceae bacterium]